MNLLPDEYDDLGELSVVPGPMMLAAFVAVGATLTVAGLAVGAAVRVGLRVVGGDRP